jgi:hypothetical protein
MTYLLKRDGRTLSEHDTHNQAFIRLLQVQGQSADWAMTHEGYEITEGTTK